LLVTSAAGSLRPSLCSGDLVVIRDIIDLQNRQRALGGRDVAVHVDSAATRAFELAATRARVRWQRGTMFCTSGPLYETMADVGMLQFAGGDVATMSGAPEVTRANELGLASVAVAVVTNPCTGIHAAVPSHGEVLEASARAAVGLAAVIRQFVTNI
jgi:purine-nucleoside phosphorylase